MPVSEHASGGVLKLKGGGVDKHKKKRKKVVRAEDGSEPSTSAPTSTTTVTTTSTEAAAAASEATPTEKNKEVSKEAHTLKEEAQEQRHSNKTEAERRHDELRRRRLDQRLQREGAKTHKQRVEELNKYLSTLSEHHDMPRIGPG